MLLNLAGNAVKFTNEGGVGLAVSKSATGIDFTVSDTGPGIAEEDLERIFDSFFTTKDMGMGIGLAICRSIVVAHGGSITVSNHIDGGAQFRLSLPPAVAE